MVTIDDFRQFSLALPNTIEASHFEKTSFRVRKKIFASLSLKSAIACVKLSLVDQYVFCLIDPATIYPVPNKWGLQGWTNVNLQNITPEILADLLNTAYNEVSKLTGKN